MKEIFEKEKIDYKNIHIPEELASISIKSIDEFKRRNKSNIIFLIKIVLLLLIIFILLIIFLALLMKT